MILAFLMLIGLAVGQCGAAEERAIYEGNPGAELGMTFGAWGSGTAEETSEEIIANSKSIKIVSQGFYSGGRIEFGKPVLIYSDASLDAMYLRLMISFKTKETISSLYDYGETRNHPTVSKIRLVLYPEARDQSPIEVIIPVATADQDGWWPIAVPLSVLKSLAKSENLKVRRMIISSDIPDTIYIGEMRIIKDTTPISVEPLEPQPTSPTSYDTVVFTSVAAGGLTPLVHSWDFNKNDGIQEDATGEQVTRIFGKSGDYVVTLTVRDHFGVKKEATTSAPVFVND